MGKKKKQEFVEVELDLDDDTYAKLKYLADENEVTVEEMTAKILEQEVERYRNLEGGMGPK